MLRCIAPEREVVIAATLVLEAEEGCDSDIQDSASNTYMKTKERFLNAVSVKNILSLDHQ